MNTGTVKFFNDTKGYGFIKEDETDKEYFVHVSGLVDEISENERNNNNCEYRCLPNSICF